MLFKIIFICVVLKYASGQGALNKEFKLERYFKANWYDANIFCRDHGMQLATVNSDTENGAIIKLVKQVAQTDYFGTVTYDNIWISATDLAQEGHFTWFSSGNVVTYTSWGNGQPFRADPSFQYDEFGERLAKEKIYENSEDCVYIQGMSGWANANCTDLNYFLCESV